MQGPHSSVKSASMHESGSWQSGAAAAGAYRGSGGGRGSATVSSQSKLATHMPPGSATAAAAATLVSAAAPAQQWQTQQPQARTLPSKFDSISLSAAEVDAAFSKAGLARALETAQANGGLDLL